MGLFGPLTLDLPRLIRLRVNPEYGVFALLHDVASTQISKQDNYEKMKMMMPMSRQFILTK